MDPGSPRGGRADRPPRRLPDRGAARLLARRGHAIACAAAALARSDEVVRERSAAILHGLPTLVVPAVRSRQRAEPSASVALVRLALHDDAFPPPELQAWVGRDRVDLYWPRYRFIIEADGRGKYSDDELWPEKQREQRLRKLDNRVERVVWADVTRDWPTTRMRLWSGLGGKA